MFGKSFLLVSILSIVGLSHALEFSTKAIFSVNVMGEPKTLVIKNNSASDKKIDSVVVAEKTYDESWRSCVVFKGEGVLDKHQTLTCTFDIRKFQASYSQVFHPGDSVKMSQIYSQGCYGCLNPSASETHPKSDESLTLVFYTSDGKDTVFAKLFVQTSAILQKKDKLTHLKNEYFLVNGVVLEETKMIDSKSTGGILTHSRK